MLLVATGEAMTIHFDGDAKAYRVAADGKTTRVKPPVMEPPAVAPTEGGEGAPAQTGEAEAEEADA